MKILLLEDEYLLSRAIRKYLLMKNYFVDDFDNGQDVLDIVAHKEYDFFILDINTPIVGGLDCLKVISALYPQVPKIVISAYDDIEHITQAFELGCSDYLKKPFNLKELEIRINRLTTVNLEQKVVQEHGPFVQLSQNYKFNKDNNMLYYKNEIQKFSKREYALIGFFVTHLNHVIAEDALRTSVWEDEDVQTSTLRSLINRLRGKLQEELIENIRGFGYIMKVNTAS